METTPIDASSLSISLVVVCYERELDMLSLLARSIERYVDPELVSEIVIVDNTYGQADFRTRFEARVLRELPVFRSRVRYVGVAELGVEINSAEDGYVTQQAAKLEAARLVSSPHYLVLDAKNHFVSPLKGESLFAADGQPLSEYTVLGGYLATCAQVSFDYWGQVLEAGARSLPTVTPYLMITDAVRGMLSDIESTTGRGVADLIRENDRRTEFLLYAGYLEREGGMFAAYAERRRPYATLFAKWPQETADVLRVIDAGRSESVYAMGVHAKRFGQLTPETSEALSTLWVDAGLFATVADGLTFIARQAQLTGGGDETAPDVLVGRGDRMSIGAGTNNLLDQHTGKIVLESTAVDRWRRTLDLRDAYCRARGIDYGFLVAPDTFSVHAEDFEAIGTDSDGRPVRQILDSAPEFARIVYPLEPLRLARNTGIVCHTADSHWSGYGAYIAYRELQKALPRHLTPISEDAVEVMHMVGSGDLGDKFEVPVTGEYSECVVRAPRSRPVWNNGVNNRGYMGLWTSARKDLPRGVLFMDSYGWKLQRFLAESFSSLFVVHSPYFEWEPVERFRPDVVVNLMAERFLIRVPDDHTPEPALVTARKKLSGADYISASEYLSGTVQ